MKIGVIGGASVRTPLLAGGLADSDLPLDELALFDCDADRLGVIAPLAQRLAEGVRVRSCATVAECVEGCDFVFTSFRVGGIETRARHEAAAVACGAIGQETVGPVGFAMARATIPQMVRYAREVERRAPRAWIVNFTNPVGIITQAVQAETNAKIIGICDTPTELFEEVARVLGRPSSECHFDYFGLNHLGWLREVSCRGEPLLHSLWGDPDRLTSLYRTRLFDPAFLTDLRLLPTEYVYFYCSTERALRHLTRAGESRGSVLVRLNERLFADLARAEADPAEIYRRYLAERDSGYLQIESGAPGALSPPATSELTGYDKIALAVVRAIHFSTGAILPLDVANRGNIGFLEDDDVVEVPCAVDTNGPHPLHVPPIPDSVSDLIVRVKEYERLTIRAGLTGTRESARAALAANPLVATPDLAENLISAMEAP